MTEVLAIFIGIIGMLCIAGYVIFCFATFATVVFEYLPEHEDGMFTKILIFLGLILGIAFTLYGMGAGCDASEEISDMIKLEGFAITVGIGIIMWVWMDRDEISRNISQRVRVKRKQKANLQTQYEDSLKRSIKEYTSNYRRY